MVIRQEESLWLIWCWWTEKKWTKTRVQQQHITWSLLQRSLRCVQIILWQLWFIRLQQTSFWHTLSTTHQSSKKILRQLFPQCSKCVQLHPHVPEDSISTENKFWWDCKHKLLFVWFRWLIKLILFLEESCGQVWWTKKVQCWDKDRERWNHSHHQDSGGGRWNCDQRNQIQKSIIQEKQRWRHCSQDIWSS